MKRISTLLFCLGLYTANAQVITYSESFTGAVSYSPGSPQYDNWISFRAQLDTAVYTFTKISIRGSNDPVGKSCTDVGTVNLIATALKDGDPGTSFTCGGVVWRVGDCAGGTELNANNLGTDCSCTNPGYTIRPKVGGGDWGGINSATCNAASQVMTVEFRYYVDANTFEKAFHAYDYDECNAVIGTNDNAYAATGYAAQFSKSYDVFLTKTDSAGNEIWSQNYGGTGQDIGYDVQQCADSGYIIVGETRSFGAGGRDVYLIRTDETGNTLWTKSYGGTSDDFGKSVKQTSDGGFIIAGETASFGVTWSAVFLIRTDANGDTLWTRTFDEGSGENGEAVLQTLDGGFIVAGKTSQPSGGWNFYVIKTDGTGAIDWMKSYDATSVDIAKDIKQTADGGYIIAGRGSGANTDFMLLKIDVAGNVTWSKLLGGTSTDLAYSVSQTSDGGYILAGKTTSFGLGLDEGLIIRTDANGNEIWSKTLGGSNDDVLYSIIETNDDGFLVGGTTKSFGQNSPTPNAYLIKINAIGNVNLCTADVTNVDVNSATISTIATSVSIGFGAPEASTATTSGSFSFVSGNNSCVTSQNSFQKVHGGISFDEGNSIQQTQDGGYILGGSTQSFGAGNLDAYLVKMDSAGGHEWSKTFGGTGPDIIHCVRETSDGGFIAAGRFYHTGFGAHDCYVIRTNSAGDTLWTNTFGGTSFDYAHSIVETYAGSFVITGFTQSIGAGNKDVYVLKMSSVGDIIWDYAYGATGEDIGHSIVETADRGYMVLGESNSFSGGDKDLYLLRLDSVGDTLWTQVYGGASDDMGYSIKEAGDGGFIIAGETSSYGAGGRDVYLIKTDKDGTLVWSKTYGGSLDEIGYSVSQTRDAGFVITGSSATFGDGPTAMYTIRITPFGDTLWTRQFSGYNSESGQSVIQANDGGYVIGGSSRTFGQGWDDFTIVKTDSDGNSSDCHESATNTTVTSPATTNGPTTTLRATGNTARNYGTIVGVPATVSEDLKITTSIDTAHVSCNGGSDGAADLTVSAGSSLSYLWSNSATTQDITNLTQGTYSVRVTDANSCIVYDTVLITEPPLLVTPVSGTDITCNGGNDGTATVTPSGGTPPYNYFWSVGQITPTAIDLYAGTYTVNVADLNGCPANNIITLTEPDVMSATIAGTDATCIGGTTGSADLTVSDGTPPYTYAWSNGPATQDISAIGQGTYTVTVTDNCVATVVDSVVITQPPALASSISGTDISCNGFNDGEADLTVSGGTLPYAFAWSNAATSEDISSLSPNTYSVTITDFCTITKTDAIVIAEPGLLTSSMSKTDVTCNGGGDGTATVTVGGGTGPFNYVWSNGQTTSSAVNLFPGTHSVNIFDANGCLATNSISVSEPAALAISIAGTDVTCYGGTSGAADLTVTGGTPPYAYSWSNGPTSQDISTIGQGTYTVTVTDDCADTSVDSVVIAEPPALASSINGTDISCNGFNDGEADLSVSGGTTPYTFAWSNAATSEDITGLSPNTYSVTITDFCTITKTDAILIAEPGLLTSLMSKTDVTCNGGGDGTATVTVGGGTGPFNYVWSNGQTTSSAVNLFPGTHSVNIFDANGCLATNSISVSEPAALAISIAGTDVTCYGGTSGAADLTVTGGTPPFTYNWSNGPTSQDISTIGQGTYTVTVTDDCADTSVDSVVIAEPPALASSINGTDISCNGFNDGEADLSVSGGTIPYTYAWSNAATSEDITGLSPNTYSVTITDVCTISKTDAILIAEPGLLTSSMSKTDVTCYGGGDGTATVTVGGGTAPFNYVWSTGQTTSTAVNLFPGTHAVNIFDANGCLATNSISVSEPAAPASSISGTDVTCIAGTNGAADLTVSGGTLPYLYAWSNSATSEDLSNVVSGTYTVTITDACSIVLTDSITLTEPPALGSSIVVTNITCNGSSDGSLDLTISGGTPPYTYDWSTTETTQDIGTLDTGTYTVNIFDACSAPLSDGAVVTEPAVLTTTMSETDATCNGGGNGTATVTASGGTMPYNYLWNNGQTTSTAVGLFPGSYSVNVIDLNGCLASNFTSVSEPAALAGTIVGSDATCNAGTDGGADLTVTGGTAPYTFIWSNSAATEDLVSIPAGTYTVTVTGACSGTYTETVIVAEPPALSSSIVITHISCNGNTDGSADLSVSGGTQPYTFTWSTTETTEDIATLDTGTFIVIIEDACGATLNDTAIVTEPLVLNTTISSINVTCYGGGNGTATVTAAGGTMPYNYLWSNGQVTSTAVGLFPGNYTVNVTDANGCLASDIVSITQPPALTATIVAITNVVCNGDSTGIAVVNGGGGTAPYNYLWDDVSAQTDSNATGLPAGSYNVQITDFCGATMSQSTSIAEPPALSISTSKTDVSCFGYADGIAGVAVSGGTGPFTYSWSPGGGTTPNISGLAPGTHTVIVTSGCVNILTDSAIVAEPTVLTTSMASTDVSCNTGGDGTATVTAGGGIPPYNYLWSNGQSDSTAIGLFPGAYSVNITDLNGCLTSDVVTITEPLPMTASLSSTPVSCMVGSNGTATVNPSGGTQPYTYNWSPTGGTAAVATNLPEDTYTITLTDSCGATIVDSIVVGGPSSMSIALVGTNVSCNGFNDGSVDLTVSDGTAPINYLWSNGDTTEDVSGLSPGMYSVIVTDSCGTALTDSLLISEPAPLTTSISSVNATCNGQGDGTASVAVAGGTTPYNYTWNNGQFTSTSFALFPGNYSVNVIDFNGCLVTDLVTITEPAALSIAVTITDATCGETDGAGDALVTGGISPYTYSWSSGGSAATESALAGGNYSLLVTDTNGCMDSVDMMIPITSPVQEICMITVDSTSTRNVVVWEKPVVTNIDSFRVYRDILGTYTWVGSQEYNIDSYFTDSTNGINPQVTSYRYKVTALDVCGNESAMSEHHETMHLQINTSGGAANLLWDDYEGFDTTFLYRILRDTTGMGGTNFDSINSVTNNNFTYSDLSPPANSTYLVEVVHPWGGCTADKGKNFNSSKSNTSAAGEQLSATTSATDASAGGCDGTATVNVTGGVEPYTYLWDGSTGFQATATAAGLCAGNYQVTVTDASGDTLVTSQVVGEGSEPPLTASTASTDATAGICDGTATVTASGGTQPYTYVWDGNANSQTTQTATGLCPGTYSVNVFDSLGNMTTVFATVGEIVGFRDNGDYETQFSVSPNPFTHSTEIRYTLKGESVVTLEVYNLIGERIVLLVQEKQVAGEFTYTFSRTDEELSAGVYIVALRVNGTQITRRIVALQ